MTGSSAGGGERPSKKVVVIGAGVLGATVAAVFARANHSVTVVEAADGPATGVTSLGSGGFRHQFANAEETQFVAATVAGWDTIERDNDISLGLHHNGYLMLATGEMDAAALELRAGHLRDAGVEHRFLDASELSTVLPGLRGTDVSGDARSVGLLTPTDGYTSPAAVVDKLVGVARSDGADFRFRTRVVDMLIRGDAVSDVRVQTDDGDEILPADLVVNAAGLRAPEIGRLVGDVLPVTAWRQHQYRTNDAPGGLPVFPCTFDPGASLYFRPDGDGALVGYHEDAEAWAEDYTPTQEMAQKCLAALQERWPQLAELGLRRHWVGCYEVTPDWRALIGLSAAVRGSAYLCGMSGHGLMNSLGAAEELRRLVDGEDALVDLAPFSAGRFAS